MRSDIEHEGVNGLPAGRELDAGVLGRALRRNRRWIIGPALVCCAAAIVFVSVVHPRYTADAKVIVENGESYFTRPDKGDLQQSPPLPDDEAVQSQVQLISSRDIAREAIRRLGLKGNPEFDPLAKGIDPLSRVLILLGLESDPTRIAPEDRILQSYYDHLQVFPVVKSRVITIEFTATDPDLAAKAANTIADLYIQAESDAKRTRARSAAESLATLVGDLRTRVAAAETKADEFRSQSGLLLGSNSTTITTQQLGDINTQLAQARTAEADAQAKAKLIREMIRQGRIGDVPDVANNELIRRISEQRVTLRAQIALQSRTLLPGHPHMQELNAQLADVDVQLHSAAEKAIRTLENDARIAASRVENLSAALDAQKKTVSTAGVDQVELNTLDSQARLLKDQLDFNTAKYQEALARENATSTPADARVISKADSPQLPSFPKKLPIVAIATLAGLILSIAILIARELLSGRAFVDSEAAQTALPQQLGLKRGLPAEAETIAAADGGAMPPGLTAERLVDDLRQLRQRRAAGEAACVLLTSASSRPETALASLAIARRIAADARAILVDFDRLAPAVIAPAIASAAAPESEPAGLSELLAGEATFAEIIHRDAATRLHVVPVGREDLPDGSGGDYRLVLEALAETYDFVLLHVGSGQHGLMGTLLAETQAVVLVAAEQDDEAGTLALRDRIATRTSSPVFVLPPAALAPSADLARTAA
ncbi:MAG TPA: Wzz/FepE/Etk N-terminal domain-containing protein [Lichenihabitans sp.]|nr:Wzz/FepE/Etk N-terminal domain-containing protein [Lichenihabitans sp.]